MECFNVKNCHRTENMLIIQTNFVLICHLVPSHLAVIWMTSSVTDGNWKKGSQTHFEKAHLRNFLHALRWNYCTGCVTTAWMLLMSLTCLRYTFSKMFYKQLNIIGPSAYFFIVPVPVVTSVFILHYVLCVEIYFKGTGEKIEYYYN